MCVTASAMPAVRANYPGMIPPRLVEAAYKAGVIDDKEYELLKLAEEAREEAVRVDAFDLDEMPLDVPDAFVRHPN